MIKDPFSAVPQFADKLAFAAWCGSLSEVRRMAAMAHRDINNPSAGRTPLLWAVSKARMDVMFALLQNGAKISCRTAEGDSALACAVWSGDAEMVKQMLKRGFDPAETGVHGKTALDWSREGGFADIIKVLEEPTRLAVARHQTAESARRQKSLNALARQKKHSFRL